ncbi:MAG: histidinol phosphate phosphatase domain-containing protein, partial [Thiobacillus sp.]|nr:histidinol phosphate phosphatase domain-containing protein [Thiobacillus sp.]
MARDLGLEPFRMFEISLPAIVIAVIGCGFMFWLAPRLLPVRETLTRQFTGSGDRLFMTELFVPEGSRLAGRTLKEARLTSGTTKVLNLFRGDDEISAPPPDTPLMAGDRVVVRSRSSGMMDLRSSTDLVSMQARTADPHDFETLRRRDVVMVEAIVGQTSRYVLRPIRDLDLAARYGIHLIAVHRKNASIADIGDDFQLQFGDVLLVESTPAQIKRFCDNGDLFAITDGKAPVNNRGKAPIALATIAGVMLLAALNVMPIEGLAIIGAVIVVAHGETLVEPVHPGTNRAAIEARVDILAHPGLITRDEAELAAKNGVHLELTARKGHSLSNGYVAKIAEETGARLVIDTDTHEPGDLIDDEFARAILLGAGLSSELIAAVLRNSRELAAKAS